VQLWTGEIHHPEVNIMAAVKFPWSKEYTVFGIPKTFTPYPNEPVYDILAKTAKKYKRNGLIQNNYKITYQEVKDHVDRLATALHEMGLKKGDRVATILPTSIQFIIADYAISRAGLVQIPSSSLEPPANLEHKFREGKPDAIIFLDEYADIVSEVVKKTPIPNLIITAIDDYSNNPPENHEETKISNVKWMKALIDEHPPSPPDITFNSEEDLETLLFTGGTTGLPKGCMLSHRNIYANSIQNLHGMGQAGLLLRGTLSVLLGLPFFHSYGHVIMHSMTLFGFNQILITDPRDSKAMVDMIKNYRPLLQIGVPTQFMNLCNEELGGIGMIGLSGSAPLPPSAQKEYEEKTSGGLMEGYGLSEMSPVTHLNTSFLIRILGGRIPVTISNLFLRIPGIKLLLNSLLRLFGRKLFGIMLTSTFSFLTRATAEKPKKNNTKKSVEKRGTIGVPFPDTQVKLICIETGKEISWKDAVAGQIGEMHLNGPQRMLGYWPNRNEGINNDGFINTSDVVRVDENGYFYIVDRTKDMIIVSGYKVYSRELDDILFNHADIDMAATIGVPDPDREGSEKVIVYIQPKSSSRDKMKEKDVIDYLKTRVAKYAIPQKVFIVDRIPLTEVQKINKKELRKMALEQMEKDRASV